MVFIHPFSRSDNPLIYVEMDVTDNPPAYNADVLPSRNASTYLPPPTVDQVHIFSRHEDIKGTLA